MAVQSIPGYSSSRIQLQTGTDAQGNPVYSYRTLNRVKSNALDQDIYDVVSAMMDLQQHQVVVINREDSSELVDIP